MVWAALLGLASQLGLYGMLGHGVWPTIWKDILLTGLAYGYTKLPDTIKDRGFTYGNIRR